MINSIGAIHFKGKKENKTNAQVIDKAGFGIPTQSIRTSAETEEMIMKNHLDKVLKHNSHKGFIGTIIYKINTKLIRILTAGTSPKR